MPVIINGSTGISGNDGSASVPTIQGTDTNTGMFFPAADQIAFAEGGVEAMRLDASGNVGIGTSSPAARFQVDSSSATYSANIRARNSNFGNGVIGAASGILTVATDMNNMAFYTASNLGVDGTSAPTNERMRLDSSGNLQFNSGYGSVATAYGCRAWVNFNGTGTVAIRSSGGVSSITDNSNGNYTVNLSFTMPDTNYSFIGLIRKDNAIDGDLIAMNPFSSDTKTTTAVQVRTQFRGVSYGYFDPPEVNVAIFR